MVDDATLRVVEHPAIDAEAADIKRMTELIGSLLELVRAGQVRGIALVGDRTDGSIHTAWRNGRGGDSFRLLGGLDHVKHQINERLSENWRASQGEE